MLSQYSCTRGHQRLAARTSSPLAEKGGVQSAKLRFHIQIVALTPTAHSLPVHNLRNRNAKGFALPLLVDSLADYKLRQSSCKFKSTKILIKKSEILG